MRNQATKLAAVKKSCATTKNVINIFKWIFIAIAIICAVAGIVIFANSAVIDTVMAEAAANDELAVRVSDFETNGLLDIHVEVQQALEEGRYALVFGAYTVAATVILVVFAVIMGLIAKVFKVIETSESPFCDSVLKKLRSIFILLVVLTLLFESIGFAVMLALSFWCIYKIMDYGTALQLEVDETL